MSGISAKQIEKFSLLRDKKIIVYDTIDSTNKEARRLAETGANECVIIANSQTAGRGRLGRQFYSPKDSGIYMSFLLKNNFALEETVLITTAVSVAVCRAIERTANVFPKIKWVNDLYLKGRKICGILTEAVNDFKTGRIEYIIVGIGINCDETDFPDEIANIAGAIGNNIDRNRLIAEIIREFDGLRSLILEKGFIEEYKNRSLVIGKEIKILGNPPETAKAIDIDDFGGLIVQTDNGEIKTLSSGEISIRLCGDNM